MASRLKRLGIVLTILGFAFIAAGGYAFLKTQEGAKSLNAFSAAQGVELTYNDQGQLVDRGEHDRRLGVGASGRGARSWRRSSRTRS